MAARLAWSAAIVSVVALRAAVQRRRDASEDGFDRAPDVTGKVIFVDGSLGP